LQNGKFEEVGESAGKALQQRYVGRGAAIADLMNDGRQYILMSQLDGAPVLLRPEAASSRHWLRLRLVGGKSNRDGLGARVEVVAGGKTLVAENRGNASFESANDPRLHFGLGRNARVESIIVRWPSGSVDRIGVQPADREITIAEGEGLAPGPAKAAIPARKRAAGRHDAQ
jgi:hypothetical protein